MNPHTNHTRTHGATALAPCPGPESLAACRAEIDAIDAELVALFKRRMAVSQRIGRLKGQTGLAVQDTHRERQVISLATERAGLELAGETAQLMRTVLALSRDYQRRMLADMDTPLLPEGAAPGSQGDTCAYQGIPGGWGQQAAGVLAAHCPQYLPCETFEDVLAAVENGAAGYGVLPIENSRTGAIGETWDLILRHGCYIVAKAWTPIRQCLLGTTGSSPGAIRQVLSHPEALKQCRGFLAKHPWAQTASQNTAVAAQTVARLGDPTVAAIASPLAAKLYGLQILQANIMDAPGNRTCFVMVARQPEYTAQSNYTSFTFTTRHHSGALCEVLAPFEAAGLNLIHIKSRPGNGSSFHFHAETEGNALDPRVQFALRQAALACDGLRVLGCCTEAAACQ